MENLSLEKVRDFIHLYFQELIGIYLAQGYTYEVAKVKSQHSEDIRYFLRFIKDKDHCTYYKIIP